MRQAECSECSEKRVAGGRGRTAGVRELVAEAGRQSDMQQIQAERQVREVIPKAGGGVRNVAGKR